MAVVTVSKTKTNNESLTQLAQWTNQNSSQNRVGLDGDVLFLIRLHLHVHVVGQKD